jgi:hypothetical protein
MTPMILILSSTNGGILMFKIGDKIKLKDEATVPPDDCVKHGVVYEIMDILDPSERFVNAIYPLLLDNGEQVRDMFFEKIQAN